MTETLDIHTGATRLLARAFAAGKLSHSYLIAGPEGAGKKTLALKLAAATACAERRFPPCGRCPSCRKVERGEHPDVRDYLERAGDERDALVTVVRAGSRLVGVLPLLCTRARIRGLPMRTVDLASNVVSYHPELVATEGHEALLSAGLARAHGGRWDLFRANALPVDGPSLGHLRSALARNTSCVFEDPSENSPYIRIDSSWDDFLKSRR